MEKPRSGEKSSKLGLKETTALLNMLLLVFLPSAASASYLPNKLVKPEIPKLIPDLSELQTIKTLSIEAELIKLKVQNILKEGGIDVVYNEAEFVVPTKNEYAQKSVTSLKEELAVQYIDFNFGRPQRELREEYENLLKKEKFCLFEEIKQVFESEYSLLDSTDTEVVEIVVSIIELSSYHITDEMWLEYEKKLKANTKSQFVLEYNKKLFLNRIEELRYYCFEFLKKFFLLKALASHQ